MFPYKWDLLPMGFNHVTARVHGMHADEVHLCLPKQPLSVHSCSLPWTLEILPSVISTKHPEQGFPSQHAFCNEKAGETKHHQQNPAVQHPSFTMNNKNGLFVYVLKY